MRRYEGRARRIPNRSSRCHSNNVAHPLHLAGATSGKPPASQPAATCEDIPATLRATGPPEADIESLEAAMEASRRRGRDPSEDHLQPCHGIARPVISSTSPDPIAT